MRTFLLYIHESRKTAAFFLLFTAIFWAVSAIYGTEREAVLYSFAICGTVGAAAVMRGYLRYIRKHRLMQEIYRNLPLMTEELPEPDDLTQEQLILMIRRLRQLHSENLSHIRSIRSNNMDYFTVWVHQIKTPIAAMQMILQSEDSDLSRELSAELFKVEQYAEMALNFIRLDSDSSDFVIRRCELDPVVKQAVHRYAPLFIRRRIRLDCRPVSGTVLTDEKWLVFVIEQLLSNAVKYTAKGSVTIRFEEGVLTVTDTGIGIAPEDMPRIFEKGYTGLSGRTEKKSTGLGLYLCRTVCDKLGHRLTVSSEVGQGSVFALDLTEKKLDMD